MKKMLKLDTVHIGAFLSGEEIERGLPAALQALGSITDRSGTGAEMLGWLDLPSMGEESIREIEDAAKRIQDENDLLVIVGIGGSYLGARAATEALPEEASFPVVFAGNNLSPGYHQRLFASLEGKRFAVCVISKSGTTTEPALAFRFLRRKLIERFSRERFHRRIIAVTDPEGGALRRMAEGEGYISFPIPQDVGGRFSVLSPVGLLPCAAAGIPIREMLEGASAAIDGYTRDDGKNEALRYALIRHLLHKKGSAVEVLSTFSCELTLFCEWWKQLAGESEGKEGKGLFPASAVMTTDLHSLGQYLQEGSRRLMETFLVASSPRTDMTVPYAENDPDKLNYIAGMKLGEVNRKAYEGTLAAHAAGGLPVISLEIPSITPSFLGVLFVFFEISVAVSGRLLGINPFNQPGVEEYKKRMFELLGKPGG